MVKVEGWGRRGWVSMRASVVAIALLSGVMGIATAEDFVKELPGNSTDSTVVITGSNYDNIKIKAGLGGTGSTNKGGSLFVSTSGNLLLGSTSNLGHSLNITAGDGASSWDDPFNASRSRGAGGDITFTAGGDIELNPRPPYFALFNAVLNVTGGGSGRYTTDGSMYDASKYLFPNGGTATFDSRGKTITFNAINIASGGVRYASLPGGVVVGDMNAGGGAILKAGVVNLRSGTTFNVRNNDGDVNVAIDTLNFYNPNGPDGELYPYDATMEVLVAPGYNSNPETIVDIGAVNVENGGLILNVLKNPNSATLASHNTKVNIGDMNLTGSFKLREADELAGSVAITGGLNIGKNGSMTINGVMVMENGSTISTSAASGGLEVDGGGTLKFAAGANMIADLTGALSSSAALTIDSSNTLMINGPINVDSIVSAGKNGTFTIIDSGNSAFDFTGLYNGTVNGAAAGASINIRYGGTAYSSNAGKLLLTMADDDINRIATWNGSNNSSWNETDSNWDLSGSIHHVFKNGDTVLFDDAGAGSVSVGTGLSVADMTVANSTGNDYTFTGDGIALSGATGTFTKTGTGEVTFNQTAATVNAFTSANLEGGRTNLAANNEGALGAGTVTFRNNAELGFANGMAFANDITLSNGGGTLAVENGSASASGALSGSGSLTKTGVGTLDLSGASGDYTGSVAVSAGTLKLSAVDAVGTGAIANDATLEAAFNGTLTNAITGSGIFNKTGGGTDKLILANNLTQNTVNVTAGTLVLGNGKNVTATTALNVANGTTVGVSTANGGNMITAGTATFANGSTLTADLTGADNGATALTFGPSTTLNVGGTINIDATFTGALNGIYTVIDTGGTTFNFAGTYNGLVNGQTASGMLGANIRYGGAAYDDSNIGKLMVAISGVDENRDATWGNASNDGLWNETSNNWDLAGSSLQVFKNGDAAIFGDAGAGSVIIGSGLSVANMTVDNSAGAANEYTFTGVGLAATGAFIKSGAGTVTFNQSAANAFTSANLNAGRINLNRADALGSGQVTLGNAVLGLADTLDFANNVAVSGNGSVAVESGEKALVSGVISGSGSLIKSGDGILSLSGTNTHTGDIRLDAGTLALTGTGSIASSKGLFMGAGTTFDISSLGDSASVKTITMAGGATIVGGGNTLDMTGAGSTLSFDLTGITPGSPALLDGGGALQVSSSTLLDILSPTALAKGEQVVLAENLNTSSTYTTGVIKSNRMKYDVLLDSSYNLLATFLGIASYREEANDYFGSRGLNNINLQNSTVYLDWLSELDPALLNPAILNALDQAYTDSINLGGSNASLAIQQMFGASVVYNDAAQSVTGSRFRQLLGNRNHSGIVNGLVFADASRNYFNDAGIASDDAFASPLYGARDTIPVGRSRIWASGFGAWAKQDSSANLAGFKYDAQGAAIGYEYTVANCLQFGVAAAYARGDLTVNDLYYTNKPDIMNLALYGAYAHELGVYIQGSLGYGHAWNDYTTNMILGGQKKGRYGSDEWSANLELGYVARLPQGFNLVPSVGLEYSYLRNSGWSERVSGNPALIANRFDGGHDSSVGIPLGFHFNKMFAFGCNGGYVVPEVRTSWIYMADKSQPSINAGFVNAPGSTTMNGVNPGSNFWRIGAGVSGRFNERVDFRVDYDFDTRSGFRGHNVAASVGLSF